MAVIDLGGKSYQSYEDVDGADEFLAGDISRAPLWAIRSADTKKRGLISATRALALMPWCGTAPTPDTAPDTLKEVTAMLAADLIAKPRLFADATGNSNIKNVKAGSAQVEFFAPVEDGPPLPRALWAMLLAAGLVCPPGSDDDSGGAFVSGISDGCRPLAGRWAWDWPVAAADYD